MQAEEKLKEQNVKLQELAHSERQAHEALKSAQSRMVQTEKLASLGQLVAGVAHEINNPLAFVSNNVAVLERDLRDMIALVGSYRQFPRPSDPEHAALNAQIDEVSDQLDLDYTLDNLPKLIERTREGLHRIERIVKDLRLFARVDEGEWNEVDLNPGIESSVNMVQGYARKKRRPARDGTGLAPLDSLSRGASSPGDRQPAHERDRRLYGRRRCHDPHAGRARNRGRPYRSQRHRLRHRSRKSANGSSTHSSPPSRSAKGPVSGSRSVTGSSRNTTVPSTSSPHPAKGLLSSFAFRRGHSRSGNGPPEPAADGPR